MSVFKITPLLRVLFLCTGNSCRSQMAEGWARHLKNDVLEVFSAGAEKHGLNPRAVRVMEEVGVDISSQKSKLIEELPDVRFDYVVTLCDSAREACPLILTGGKILHVEFDDPPSLCTDHMNEEECLSRYRRVRDEIKAFVERLPDAYQDVEDLE